MTAVLAALWAFANSTLGQTIVLALLGKLLYAGIKDKSRRQKLLEYATQAFAAAEAMGLFNKLGGREKYARFVEMIVNKLAAEGEAPLSAREMELLKHVAYEKAWLAKPVPRKETP